MKFYIANENGSGQEFNTKEEFLKELSLMIDDCETNGGTYFDVTADTDASCFTNDDTDENEEDFIDFVYHDCSEDELRAMGAFDNLNDEEEF